MVARPIVPDRARDFTPRQLLSCIGTWDANGWHRQRVRNGWENALTRHVRSKPATSARFRHAALSVRPALLADVALALVTRVFGSSLPLPAQAALFRVYPYSHPDPSLSP